MKRKKKHQRGQVLIEFMIVMIMVLSLLFMFIQLSFGIAWGHYVQYATFMASRALFASGLTRQEQEQSAAAVLEKMLKKADGSGKDIMDFISKARTGDERDVQGGSEPVAGGFVGTHPYAASQDMNSRTFGWAEGVQYNFQVKLFLFPSSVIDTGHGKSIQMGSSSNPSPPVTWNGSLPFTSDSWLGREVSVDECEKEMQRMSNGAGINRADGQEFLYDNGC